MTDDVTPAAAASAETGTEATTKKAAKKKTAKKKATTKKSASKKAAAKKTTKKTATKKAASKKKATTKKAAKKTPKKKAAKKASAGSDAEADTGVTEAEPRPEDESADTGPVVESDTEGEPDAKTKKPARTRKRRSRKSDDDAAEATDDTDSEGKPDAKASKKKRSSAKDKPAPRGPLAEMLINYVPGEDCRIAVVEDGRLEEFYSEPTTQVSRVGNIYVGKVTNVESQIQAAFVDFGLEEAGFLHVSDLHPRYFPGDDDATEKVGRKTPRRARPPIQQCLRKGQEIIVQVLKEGVGTKGPSLTSYLSVPGRFLVMMPDMDKVGVSRKVEDETERRKMREILDQLDLPDGFGFILRTAGYDRTKEDLDRDLAYLRRLWQDMQRLRKQGGGPRLLYSESDLLVRTIRDQLTSDVSRLVIDSQHALDRAAAFLKIVSPDSGTKLEHYRGRSPIFHAFGIEDQVALMHANEVPLPSGGRLVIDQTEALVAIDVNSGRSRGAKDAESNALNTNLEAVDEICRQLRLRDLGGLVINDLIDMRPAANRRKVEQRFHERLKRDRAKSTILPISDFGILEMTRQRMRGSYEQQHFQTCPSCSGRGLVQRPDSVAADALRDLASLLDHDRVAKVELVVSPRVAGALLSTRRAGLGRIERATGKIVEVRISESISSGRVAFYAYDAGGADLDLSRMPKRKARPETVRWLETDEGKAWAVDTAAEADELRDKEADAAAAHDAAERAKLADIPLPGETGGDAAADQSGDDESGGKKKRRRRRRGKKRREGEGEDGAETTAAGSGGAGPNNEQASGKPAAEPVAAEAATDDDHQPSEPSGDGESDEGTGKKKRRRRRRGRRRRSEDGESGESAGGDADAAQVNGQAPEDAKPKREPKPTGAAKPDAGAAPGDDKPEVKTKRRRRGLYGAGRRTLSPSEKARLAKE